jgi:hypothetical protein
MITYSLIENTVTADPDDYYGQIQLAGSADADALADRMVQMGSTVTKPDVLATLELAFRAVESLVLEGNRVLLAGIVEVSPRMQGVFNGITDSYDPARHQVGVTASAGARLRDSVRQQAQVQKDETVKPRPAPVQYVDLASGTVDTTLTKGNIGTLNGARLKFDTGSADEGIYLVPTGGAAATKITAIQRNKPAQLVFLTPAVLAAGGYWLEVRARTGNVTDLRVGRLDAVLTVA